MKTVSAGLQSHLAQEVTTVAICWKLTRVDGTGFYYTEHDQELVVDGNTYIPIPSFDATAAKAQAGLAVDNLELVGAFDDDNISEADLRSGRFDYAEVEIFLVNWDNLAQGTLILQTGWLGEITVSSSNIFKAEVRGLTQAYSNRIIELYSPDCRADLGDSRCGIPIWPDQVERVTAYVVDDYVRASNNYYAASLTITNGDAETGDITGWTDSLGGMTVRSASPSPYEGSYYFMGGAVAETKSYQDITVPAGQESAVDAGERAVSIIWQQNSFAGSDQGEVIVEFFDGDGAALGSENASGLSAPTSWTAEEYSVDIPATTRTIRLTLHFYRNSGTNNDAYFDAIEAKLVDSALISEDFVDRIYKCTTAGTTDNIQPTYDTTVGNDTTDGSAVFTAVAAWSVTVVVTGVTDQNTFTVSHNESRAVDGWFDQGAFTFESGNNAGITIEVKSWTGDSDLAGGEISLFLKAPRTIQVGDKARVYAGCDKLVATCNTKFSNTINFRGEPYVPGEDAFFTRPASG